MSLQSKSHRQKKTYPLNSPIHSFVKLSPSSSPSWTELALIFIFVYIFGTLGEHRACGVVGKGSKTIMGGRVTKIVCRPLFFGKLGG